MRLSSPVLVAVCVVFMCLRNVTVFSAEMGTPGLPDTYSCVFTNESEPGKPIVLEQFQIDQQASSNFQAQVVLNELIAQCHVLENYYDSAAIQCGFYGINGARFQRFTTLWGVLGGFDIFRNHKGQSFWIRCDYHR